MVAGARALPYGAGSFDLVVSMAALGFIKDQRAAIREMIRVARRRGACWHTTGEATDLLAGLPVQRLRVRTAIHLPGGGRLAQVMERLRPQWLHTSAFILIVADVAAIADASPNNGMQRTALRAAADSER